MEEQDPPSTGAILIDDTKIPENFPSVAGESVFIQPTQPSNEIQRLWEELLVKEDIIQKQNEEICHLKRQLQAAQEGKERHHGNANNTSVVFERDFPGLEEESKSMSLVPTLKTIPQIDQEAHDSLVMELPKQNPVQLSAALSSSDMVTGSLQQQQRYHHEHQRNDHELDEAHLKALVENLQSKIYCLESKIGKLEFKLRKGNIESKSKTPNKYELFLEIEHKCDDHVPNFNCPEFDPTLQSEFDKLHSMGYKGDNIAIALMGPEWNISHVKNPQNVIAVFPEISHVKNPQSSTEVFPDPPAESGGHHAELLLKSFQFLLPKAKLILCHTTTDVKGLQIDPRISNEAIQWITKHHKEWKEEHKLEGIFIYIPYGGKYNVNEDKVVNDAIASGINLVCAAGCRDTGIVFPAAVGTPLCCGAAHEHVEAEFSPHGRELDFLSQGFIQYGRCCLVAGTSCAALTATAKLVILVQHIVQTVGCAWPYMAQLKEVLLLSSESNTHSHDSGHGILEVYSIINMPADQMKAKLQHITEGRDRQDYKSELDKVDANRDLLASQTLNDHWKDNDESFPDLKGYGITVALIDDDFGALIPTKDGSDGDHGGSDGDYGGSNGGSNDGSNGGSDGDYGGSDGDHGGSGGDHGGSDSDQGGSDGDHGDDDNVGGEVPHRIISGRDLLNFEGLKMLCPQSHGVQCAVVIAFIAPDVRLLLVNEHFAMYNLIRKKRPDVLALSALHYDTYDFQYNHAINSLARNCVVVCAAGNEGSTDRHNTLSYPARCGNVITIGGCNQLGERLDFSSFGREMDFMAPARFSIADPSGVAGTSLAAPAAAAEIALILEYIDQNLTGISRVLNEKNEWVDHDISKLVRNTHLMRAILRCPQLQLCQSPKHSPYSGHGMLLIENLCTVRHLGIKKVIEESIMTAP